MRFLTVLGLLALPSYGGNAGKVGWKLVGFVDQHVWEPPFGYYDKDYPGFAPYPKRGGAVMSGAHVQARPTPSISWSWARARPAA